MRGARLLLRERVLSRFPNRNWTPMSHAMLYIPLRNKLVDTMRPSPVRCASNKAAVTPATSDMPVT